ncbi:probable E3 ubiquitin-protein ligase MGRN1 [Macrosteles quadrilineatus]|uniref:probable E3 ubiquitin-protein ligase MGRN1 n=1 Tax=Macrosteles quadrilineatus TaxID=74068 RepID=UPI0023E0F30D|nr:probable E3 ubiquitin-protein ligase MGRN1 [Macrosteles quadrilineatus]
MGALTSRQNAGVEEVDIVSNHAYKYPPKSGNYFGSHFIMGGERFDTPQPEAYLFGENADLNFLGSRPTPFPYPPPQANEPTKTLKCLVNIRKESLRLVRAIGGGKGDGDVIKPSIFNLEFTFDCDARTAITIYYFATEEFTPNGVVYCPKDPSLTSETFYYKRGTNQLFSQPAHIFDPSRYTDEELSYNPDKEVIPIAIHCVAYEGPAEDQKQSHTSIAVVERHSDGTYVLKALKQRLYVDGLCYLLQEIYGIENKGNDIVKGNSDDETEDNGSECVICMCDVRDTLILPCRHLCLCNSCADSLRYQANNCPICRAPFRALLQIRALQKSTTQLPSIPQESNCENIPAGYEAVSLIEALNGPSLGRSHAPALVVALDPLETDETAVQAAEVLNRSCLGERIPTTVKLPPESGEGPPEVRMSVLLAREGSEKTKSPLSVSRRRDKTAARPRDTVRVVNEMAPNQDETQDEAEDSEAEKLSPLLDGAKCTDSSSPPQEEEGEDDPCPTDRDQLPPNSTGCEGNLTVVPTAGEDSDYYTPEDPATTILSPLHSDKENTERVKEQVVRGSSGEAIGRWMVRDGLSLPGTPQSTASHRSSGDSYSSSGSTRLLLSASDKTTAA